MRRSLVIALVMAVMQQWVGVNTLLFYGSITLNDVLGWKAQTAGAPALGALALIGGVNFLSTILALYLIDRIGRKALLIISAGAMAVCWIGLAVLFAQPHPPAVAVVVAMFLCTGTFAVGMGPVVWVLLGGDLSDQDSRARDGGRHFDAVGGIDGGHDELPDAVAGSGAVRRATDLRRRVRVHGSVRGVVGA